MNNGKFIRRRLIKSSFKIRLIKLLKESEFSMLTFEQYQTVMRAYFSNIQFWDHTEPGICDNYYTSSIGISYRVWENNPPWETKGKSFSSFEEAIKSLINLGEI